MMTIRMILTVVLCVGLLGTTPVAARVESSAVLPAPPTAQEAVGTGSPLVFRVDGHLVTFLPGRACLAALDHALCVEFAGAAGTAPRSTGAADVQGGAEAGSRPDALGEVHYERLWPGIDLVYSGVGGSAKATYHLAPGADPALIRLRYNVPARLQPDGSLRFQVASDRGALTESAPVAWQEIGGRRAAVAVAFVVAGDSTVSFRLGAYDPRYPLTIDPTYEWHTFYGSVGGDDYGIGMAVDAAGNVYITGYSDAPWQGDGGAEPLHAHSGGWGADIFVAKLDASGAYQWHTFYGAGSSWDYGGGIVLDAAGNVYVTGSSYATWDGPAGQSPLHPFGSSSSAVVLKLDGSGAYQWHTFYGTRYYYWGWNHGLALDAAGGLYVAGTSYASWLGAGSAPPIHAHSGYVDLTVLKLDTDGAYQWHTFYGSVDSDYGSGLALDGAGGVYVAGVSSATWQGDGSQEPLHAFTGSGSYNLVVLKLDGSGVYQWHTFYGESSDYNYYSWWRRTGVATDGAGGLYVVSCSDATWQGDGGTAPLHAHTGDGYPDIAVLKLNSSGAYQWHTFYGGTYWDYGGSVTVDGAGYVYVAGESDNSWNGSGGELPLHDSGSGGLVVLKLDGSGAYQWHTFYGYGSSNGGLNIALDSTGNIHVAGSSWNSWQGDGAVEPLHSFNSGSEIAALKLDSSGAYQWHTFYGSEQGNDYGQGVAVDAAGNMYIAGYSDATWQGDGGTEPLHPHSGGGAADIFVVKLDTSGAYQWHTFYGAGSSWDYGGSIVLDAAGNVYVTGSSQDTWSGPVSEDPLHPHRGLGNDDLVVLKLDSNGSYQWHTFYGSSDYYYWSWSHGLALDAAGGLYVAGTSYQSWLGPANELPIHTHSGYRDLAVLKLDTDGAYQWHTFYGSGGEDYGAAVAVDGAGGVYLVGGSDATWQGDGSQEPLHPYTADGNYDLVVLKLNSSGAYQWHTFYGESLDYSSWWWRMGVATDGAGGVYVASCSYATWQGDGGAEPLHPHTGDGYGDLALLKLDSNGAYQWHTFYGGTDWDYGGSVAVDGAGYVYVAGESYDSWNGSGGEPPLHESGSGGLVVLKLDGSGTYQWHAFYGYNGEGASIALDRAGNMHAVAADWNNWYGDGGVEPLHPYSGDADLMVLKIAATTVTSVDQINGGTLVFTDMQGLTTTLQVPPAAVTLCTDLVYTPLLSPTEALDPGDTYANHAFFLHAYPCAHMQRVYLPLVVRGSPAASAGERGTARPWLAQDPADPLFHEPVTMTIEYSDADIAGIADESTLRVVYWTGSTWEDMAGTCGQAPAYERDVDNNVIRFTFCHMSQGALAGN
ncbi:MAG: SBBP repeat-containing protein [Anaerolineae bacterium]|nr:SBBP repeat-containing protein [Anaerolineae bacterium]